MSVRRRALETLRAVTERGAYANLALKQAQRGLDARDAAWVAAAVYTTLDHLAYIDLAIDRYAKGKRDAAINAILRLGMAQAFFMDTPPSAACNESVNLARETGKAALSGYVNAVMRTACREGLPELPENARDRLTCEFGYPAWLVDEYIEDYGEAGARSLMAAKNVGLTLRAQHPFTASELEAELDARGVSYTRGKKEPEAFVLQRGFDVEKEPLFTEGKIAVMSESAMLVCRSVCAGLDENAMILDCCAAPGGKSAGISSFMRGEGHIDAWEKHPHRAELMANTLGRLHVDNVSVTCRDAGAPADDACVKYDAVLADVPCSGFGVPGKPDIRYKKTDEDIEALVREQKRIIDAVSRLVKPGGKLVYATCTVSRRENGRQAARFLAEHKEFGPSAETLPACIRERAVDGGVQLLQDKDGTDGFYIAAFVRKAD